VLLNDGHGGFIASNLGTAPDRTYSAALADIDGDVHLDIVVSNDAPDRKLLYRNDGKGTVYSLAFADFDGDGWPDIVAARSDAPNGIWFSTKPGDRR